MAYMIIWASMSVRGSASGLRADPAPFSRLQSIRCHAEFIIVAVATSLGLGAIRF